ncbi:hypothetical protein CFH99_24415 [Nocardioides aromaticivorans]|uniref:Methyltransferase n=2 Tax=Nocardioides aromaticivorans TaxID=200618 RepID=A0ABX7PSU8_9ACTN|nr:hypothetical protein CFH99_24415 [Nocardioides aromaticivorans]
MRNQRVDARVSDAHAALLAVRSGTVDAIVTDPPYAIRRPTAASRISATPVSDLSTDQRASEWLTYAAAEMLGQQSANWRAKATHSRGYADNDPAHFQRWCELWLSECLRVLKPGGHLIAFGGTRTWHRLATAAEVVGFEVRDSLAWMYGTGYPKSLDVGSAVERLLASSTRPWDVSEPAVDWRGWGTTLKPAFEPVVLARAPLDGTVANTVLGHRTGALNIDRIRLEGGRWPTNVFLDEDQARVLDASDDGTVGAEDSRPSRFFWHAKPGRLERERVTINGITHPTVKPVALMRELIRMVTPPDGTVLDPFAGSGTTVEAAIIEGMRCVAFEREASYMPLIQARINYATRAAAPPVDQTQAEGQAETQYALF